jgi:carboxypeptidase Taq
MDYLNQKIEHDSEGVMQDTHWAGGAFGYFPSYALGNIYGGQILKTMEKEVPNWRAQLQKGDFHSIKQWLTQNVYSHGAMDDPIPLLKKITGESINVQPFINYLNAKFSQLYGY